MYQTPPRIPDDANLSAARRAHHRRVRRGTVAQPTDTPTGMVAAFVDENGNDIDDACESEAVVADEAAAADAGGSRPRRDGTISVSRSCPERPRRRRELQPQRVRELGRAGLVSDPTPTPSCPPSSPGPSLAARRTDRPSQPPRPARPRNRPSSRRSKPPPTRHAKSLPRSVIRPSTKPRMAMANGCRPSPGRRRQAARTAITAVR